MARTKNGVVSGEALEKSAEGAMQRCRISQAKGQSQKRYRRKQPRNKKAVRRNEKIRKRGFSCIFQSEPCSVGKPAEDGIFFLKMGTDV